jgi:uncharacterized protein DUF6916
MKRRRFLITTAAAAASTMVAGTRAFAAPRSARTLDLAAFDELIGQPFEIVHPTAGYHVLALERVIDLPFDPGVEQFTLRFVATDAVAMPSALVEARHWSTDWFELFLDAPSTASGAYLAQFSLVSKAALRGH